MEKKQPWNNYSARRWVPYANAEDRFTHDWIGLEKSKN